MIHKDFSLAAARYPDNIAIWSEEQTLSYKELDRKTTSLSRWLNDKLPGNGHRVAIIMPKSNDAIVAILAVLKSGNTYVPLGDNWSEGRLSKICDDGQFSLVIHSNELSILPVDEKLTLNTGTVQWREAIDFDGSIDDKAQTVTDASLAYVLYTSGSTGTPKGVCVSHRAAHHFPNWAKSEFNIENQDRIASVSPLTFDLSTFDMFATLAAGATMYVVPEKYKVFPARLSEFLQTHQITIIYAVPSTLILLMQRGKLSARDLSAMKSVLFAGEEFPIEQFKQLRQLLPSHIRYCNLYGPTETNVCSFYRVPQSLNVEAMPIGCALPDTLLFVRNESNDPSQEGRGELCVAGPTVMNGYHARDDSTAEYWLDDPRNVEPRAYATGDQVSLSANGVFNYHGRLDKMVKIWGYRVELGEIESCLRELDNVAQAAVVKRHESKSGTEELVAFLSMHDNTDANTESALKLFNTTAFAHCKQNLPSYMVPKKINRLEELPLNGSGKIDRLLLEKLVNKASFSTN